MAEEKQMSQAEREARQMIADKKMEKANEAAYNRSMTNTAPAPKPAPKPPAAPEKRMAKGGSVSASRRADGIASKGKTRGTMVQMARGGKAC